MFKVIFMVVNIPICFGYLAMEKTKIATVPVYYFRLGDDFLLVRVTEVF
jgi:hypothetical protein